MARGGRERRSDVRLGADGFCQTETLIFNVVVPFANGTRTTQDCKQLEEEPLRTS